MLFCVCVWGGGIVFTLWMEVGCEFSLVSQPWSVSESGWLREHKWFGEMEARKESEGREESSYEVRHFLCFLLVQMVYF